MKLKTKTYHPPLRNLSPPDPSATPPAEQAKVEAFEIHARLETIAVVTSDYAAQIETQRKYTGTCASRERHNFLVSVVCYQPYKEPSKRQGTKEPRGEYVYKQHVDVFFAFHKAGFKPSARSFNVVQVIASLPTTPRSMSEYLRSHMYSRAAAPPTLPQEDIDHWLKYGSMLHGEWFVDGERCPGSDHRLRLPDYK